MKKSILEVWALVYDRVDTFFAKQVGEEAGKGFYQFETCEITLKALPDKALGSLMIPQTEICLEGEEEDVEKMYRVFFLNFLSAGG